VLDLAERTRFAPDLIVARDPSLWRFLCGAHKCRGGRRAASGSPAGDRRRGAHRKRPQEPFV